MAKVTSAEKLVELVEKSQLSDPTKLERALAAIRSEHGGTFPKSADDMATELQKHNVVTRWHCDKLLHGKYKGFFLGKHKLLGHLGSGGMSSVYLAEHMKMHDLRAIKVLPQSKLGKSSYLARFQQEAKAIASLNHPNIVRAHDIDNEGNTHYIVMEYVDGDDLQTIVKKKGPLSFEKVATYMAEAAHGLQHAHDVGLIHRDVKPANLLINSKGQVKLLDLGLALFADEEQASLTMDFNDKVLGTADYLAPEQALNSHKVDHRADLYGLGCTMYFLLTGHPPFPEGTIAQRIAKHQREMPKEIRKIRPQCPGELEGICWKLLQKDPKFRYPTAQKAAEVLEEWLAKYRAAKPVTVGGAKGSPAEGGESRSISAGSGSSRGGSSHARSSGSLIDTVSNRGSDTLAGRSGSSISTLSTSDSGVLVRRSEDSGASDSSSTINLELEIARRSRARSNLARQAGTAQSGTRQAGTRQAGTAQSGTRQAGIRQAGARQAGPSTSGGEPLPSKKGNRALWVVGLAIMFLLAVLLGVLIAKVTTQPVGAPVIPPAGLLPAEYSSITEIAADM